MVRHVSEHNDTAARWVHDRRDELSAWTRTIWNFAEPAWREYRSAAYYVELLRMEGFEVEAGSGGDADGVRAPTLADGEPVLGDDRRVRRRARDTRRRRCRTASPRPGFHRLGGGPYRPALGARHRRARRRAWARRQRWSGTASRVR